MPDENPFDVELEGGNPFDVEVGGEPDLKKKSSPVKPSNALLNFGVAAPESGSDSKPSESTSKSASVKSVADFNKKYSTSYTDKTIREPVSKKAEEGFGSELYNSFKAGSEYLGEAIARTPGFLYDVAAIPQNMVASMTGLPVGTSATQVGQQLGIPENEVANFYQDQYKKSKADIDAKYDKSITEYFTNGEYGKGLKLLANSVAESLPITASIAMGGAAGVGTAGITGAGGAVFGAQKKQELGENAPEMPEHQKAALALSNGLVEGFFESYSMGKIGSAVKDVLAKEGKDAAIDFAKKSFREVYTPAFRKYLPITAPVSEGIAEAETQFVQNAIDKYSGYKPDLDLTHGVTDAFLVGMGSGAAIASPAIISKVNKGKAQKIQEKKSQLEQDIQNENLPPETKAIISSQIQTENEALNDVMQQDREVFEALPDESKARVTELNDKLTKLEESVQGEISEATKELITNQINEYQTEIDGLYKEAEKEVKTGSDTSISDEVKPVEDESKNDRGLGEAEQLDDAADRVEAAGVGGIEGAAPVVDQNDTGREDGGAEGGNTGPVTEQQPSQEPPASTADAGLKTAENILPSQQNNGNEIPERLSQENIGEGSQVSTRSKALDFIRGAVGENKGNVTGDKDQQRYEREDAERKATLEFTEKNNLWVDDLYSLGDPLSFGGNEHTLAIDLAGGNLYKANNLYNSNNSITDLLEQVGLHNKIFPHNRYDLVGFTGIKKSGEPPYIEPIFKQKLVDDAVNAQESEIDEYMDGLGFKKTGDFAYSNGEYKVSDLRPRNVLKDKEGNIHVIDDIITKEVADQQKGGTENEAQKEKEEDVLTSESAGVSGDSPADLKYERHNKLAFLVGQFNRLTPSKRRGALKTADKVRIHKMAGELGYSVKEEGDGRLVALTDSGKRVQTIGSKEELPDPTPKQMTFAKRLIDEGFLSWSGNVFDDRPDLNMSWDDIRKGQKDLKDGKMSVPAKRLVIELDNIRNNAGIEYVAGSGSDVNRRSQFVTFEELGFEVDNADDVKLTPDETEELSKEYYIFEAGLSESQKEELNNLFNDGKAKIDKGGSGKTDVSDKESGIEKDESAGDLTPEELEVENAKAVEEGFTSLTHKLNAINKANGTEYARIQDVPKEVLDDFAKLTSVKHAETAKLRKEFGIPEYEKSAKSQEKLEAEADEKLKDRYDINKLIEKLESGNLPTDVEQVVMTKYLAGLSEKIAKNPTDENIAQARRAIEASDKIGGSEVGRSLAARRNMEVRDESLMDYFMTEMDANEGAPLTVSQKAIAQKEYEDISEAKKALEEKIAQLEDENNKLRAQKKVRESKAQKTKKSHEDYVKERKEIAEDIRKKLKEIRKSTNAAVIPYARELVAISPDVAKMVRSYVSEGVTELADIVKGIHESLKEEIPDITENDVRAVIAGNYNEKKLTRSEINKRVFELRQEARLIEKIEALQRGEEPKTESKKIERNRELERLRKQIRENDLTKLANYKKRVERDIKQLEDDLAAGNIKESEPRPELKLDAEAIKLKDKYIKLKQERELRLIKQRYANRNKYEKARDAVTEVLNVPRTIMSSMDFSAPLRQALVATVSHPTVAAKAFASMFKQAFSQKAFDRWFYDVREDYRYPAAEKAGLYIADPHDLRLSAKEEAFMSNLAEKIPYIGQLIKGSERAYVGYLNKMRWDLYNQFAAEYERDGKVPANSPELYKGLASYINNATGRGSFSGAAKGLEGAAPILNSLLFSPRLVASRLNFLNPLYYKKLPKEVRKQALMDVGKLIGLGTTVLALAALNGADVEDDPRSTDFGKIKVGNTRWDIWGGYQQYIRVLAQMFSGQTKSATTGKMSELTGQGAFGRTRGDVALAFIRGKLAPIPAVAADILAGRTVQGEPVTILDEAQNHLLPLIYGDVVEAIKEIGPEAVLTAGVPAMFGVGVSTYTPRHDKYFKGEPFKNRIEK